LKDTHTPGLCVAIVHRDAPEWGRRSWPSRCSCQTRDTNSFLNCGFRILGRQPIPCVWLISWSTPLAGMTCISANTPRMQALACAKRWITTTTHAFRDGGRATRMAYCHSGPAVAAYLVEKLTGQRFEDYETQNFFAPIGMNSATFFQAPSPVLTTLYRPDGKTPFPYWNILYRPAGAINASAKDMAAYVQFYLNRGTVSGTQVIPASSIDRMEIPTRTWAAKEGLETGYGLSDYWSIHDGFVYHGHNGGVAGGLTEVAYLPDYGVSYFYSINAGNGDAFDTFRLPHPSFSYPRRREWPRRERPWRRHCTRTESRGRCLRASATSRSPTRALLFCSLAYR
jgi:CubicO group peptidase (beta-lactamase class C family)